jgi:hypothetical protein
MAPRHSSRSLVIVGHLAGIERLRARLVTVMISIETQQKVEIPRALRDCFVLYLSKLGPRQNSDL